MSERAVVTLRPLTAENRAAVEALRVSPQQENFVTDVPGSLREAEEDVGGRAIDWAVYADETPVGFVMISDEVDGPGYIAHYLWKLLIDRDNQRKGYGTAALNLVSTYFRERGNTEMWTTAGEGDGSPIPFYERYGFVRTGDIIFDNEVLLRLDLT